MLRYLYRGIVYSGVMMKTETLKFLTEEKRIVWKWRGPFVVSMHDILLIGDLASLMGIS